MVVGGGSGGHITPLLAVASELKRLEPGVRIVYIGQKGDNFADIPARHAAIDEVYSVQAGKFRRYHGLGWRQLLKVRTQLLNLRDAFRLLLGLGQSYRLLKRLQPDVVFVKGGYVGVPVGLSAAWLHIPYVTHDSDALPGLANRLIARWASLHAVALPKEVYRYPQDKTVTVGVPLVVEYQPVAPSDQAIYKRQLALPETGKFLFIIGGGLGAQRVNLAVAEALPHLLHEFSDLQVVHVVGRANEEAVRTLYTTGLSTAEQGRVKVEGYLDDVYRYSGAADVIITRAGATALAEFAMQGKPCVVIPNPVLTGGHQLQNAQYLAAKHAAVVVSEPELEENPNVLAARVSNLLKDDKERSSLGKNFAAFAVPDAAKKLAMLILAQVPNTNTATAHETQK